MACTAIACIVMARGVLQCTLYVHVNAAHTLNILVITIISYNILVITRLIRLDTGAGVLIDMRADMCVGMCVDTPHRHVRRRMRRHVRNLPCWLRCGCLRAGVG